MVRISQDGGSGLPLRGSRAMLAARLQVDLTVTATPRRPWNPSRLAARRQLSHHIEESLSLPNFDQRRLPGVRTEQPRSFGGPTPPWLQRRGGLEACFERRRIDRHVVWRLGGPRRSRVGLWTHVSRACCTGHGASCGSSGAPERCGSCLCIIQRTLLA